MRGEREQKDIGFAVYTSWSGKGNLAANLKFATINITYLHEKNKNEYYGLKATRRNPALQQRSF
jgi:hypothetical protein